MIYSHDLEAPTFKGRLKWPDEFFIALVAASYALFWSALRQMIKCSVWHDAMGEFLKPHLAGSFRVGTRWSPCVKQRADIFLKYRFPFVCWRWRQLRSFFEDDELPKSKA